MKAYKLLLHTLNICLLWTMCSIFEFSYAGPCDSVLNCEHPTNFCCGDQCCNHKQYVIYQNKFGDSSADSFVKTGLKSALVLLIMSSAVFLVCFCIMKCCRKAITRHSDSQDQAVRSFLGISRQHIGSHPQFQLGLRPQPTPATQIIVDEPPSYNEVMGTTVHEDTREASQDVTTHRSAVEEKPPEYSSVVNKVEMT